MHTFQEGAVTFFISNYIEREKQRNFICGRSFAMDVRLALYLSAFIALGVSYFCD